MVANANEQTNDDYKFCLHLFVIVTQYSRIYQPSFKFKLHQRR